MNCSACLFVRGKVVEVEANQALCRECLDIEEDMLNAD